MNVLFAAYFIVQLFETTVQITGIGKTQTEKVFGHSSLSYNQNTLERYYWIDKPHTIKSLKTEEFDFTRRINGVGYSDSEWRIEKRVNEFRIMCIGDSFTEGDGAHEDSSYVAFLKRKVQLDKGKDITVMNAGKCGSDPYFNYINYKDRLQKYKPDVIIQTLATNDLVYDFMLRGGLERFDANFGLAFDRQGLFRKTLYALSYTSRPFFHLIDYVIELFELNKTSESEKRKLISEVKNLFVLYDNLAKEQHAKLIILFHPQSNEVFDKYDDLTIACEKELKITHTTFDLRDYYLLKTDSVSIYDYYWVKDGHHNAKGYNLMADGVYDFLKNNNFIKPNTGL